MPANVWSLVLMQLGTAVSLMMALALNPAFQSTFELIPVGKDGLLGKWLWALVGVGIGVFLLWLISVGQESLQEPQKP
jgi:hypothetical protein